MLTESARILTQLEHDALAGSLQAALLTQPLAKPADHSGPKETDMFQLTLSVEQRKQVLDVIRKGVAGELKTESGRSLGGFVEAWDEYSTWQDQRGSQGVSGAHLNPPV